jgi:hypothetical protein
VKLKDQDAAGIVGIRGSGKSHYAKHRLVKVAPRVVVWDPNSEYAEPCDLDEVSVDELAAESSLLESAQCRLAVVPDWQDPTELAAQFAVFVNELRESSHAEPTLVVIEECALLRPRGDGILVALATQSRHWRMPLCLLAQRTTMIPPGARSQFSIVVSFRQNDPGDLDALAERIGAGKAARAGELPRHKFIVWSEADSFKSEPDSTGEHKQTRQRGKE